MECHLTPPEKISSEHDLSEFDSGEKTLDAWLKRRAIQNEVSGASRTYVVCAGCTGKRVIGFYTLAVGAVHHEQVNNRIKRNMPDPIPVMILGRLAIDKKFQGHGVGLGLLKDAILRTLEAAKIAGIRAMLVHAISEKAKNFYSKQGFIESPIDPLTLMIVL